MKSNVKAKWIETLESGRYRQGHDQLKIPGTKNTKAKYCCLGVLCNIYMKETGKGKWHSDGYFLLGDIEEETELPRTVKEWAGLNRTNPRININGESHDISELNDGHIFLKRRSFKEIAQLIREQIPG
tara:strand:- start:789 stop:1172 length:384 start_codon:yes stop_codon:yes gene_type:complete